jgi:hypothetical protein
MKIALFFLKVRPLQIRLLLSITIMQDLWCLKESDTIHYHEIDTRFNIHSATFLRNILDFL